MKKLKTRLALLVMSALILFVLASCDEGKIKDTETSTDTETGSQTMPESQTATGPDTMSETDTAITGSETGSETMTESETGTADTNTEDTVFSDFFGKTRDEIISSRGEAQYENDDAEDNSLSYDDRYGGYGGVSRYSFGDSGTLGEIKMTFEEGIELSDVIKAITGLMGESTTGETGSYWTKDNMVYTISEEDGKIVLVITSEDGATGTDTEKNTTSN